MSTTIEQLRANREAAGAAYADFAAGYLDTWVEITAIEMVLRNRGEHIPGFSASQPDATAILRHAEFLPEVNFGNLGDRADRRHQELLGELASA